MCHWSLQILAIKLLPTTTLSRNLSRDHWYETNLLVSQYTELYFLKCLDHTVNTYPQVRFVSLSPKPNVLCTLQYSVHTYPRRAKETNFLVGSWMYIVDQLHPITKYVSWSHELMSHGTLSCDDLVINCTYCYYLILRFFDICCPQTHWSSR